MAQSDSRKIMERIRRKIFCRGNDPLAWVFLYWYSATGDDGKYRVCLSSPFTNDLTTTTFPTRESAEEEYDCIVRMLDSMMAPDIVSYPDWDDIPDLM